MRKRMTRCDTLNNAAYVKKNLPKTSMVSHTHTHKEVLQAKLCEDKQNNLKNTNFIHNLKIT